MKYCPYCGESLYDDMAFCPKCGKAYTRVSYQEESSPDTSIDEEVFSPEIVLSKELDDSIVSVNVDTQKQVPDGDLGLGSEPSPQPKKPNDLTNTHKDKRKKKILFLVLLLVLCIIVAAIFLLPRILDSSTNASSVSLRGKEGISTIAESVLYLEVYDDLGILTATASGFIVQDESTLVTNYHVIDGAYRIVANSADGRRTIDANTILAYDKNRDIAILQCSSSIGVVPLKLEDSDKAKQGDGVFAIGYPLGVANTISDGVISSRYEEKSTDIIQITAPISPGSSGGALVNNNGQVIGVICASYINGQNLNIAIASNHVADLLSSTYHPISTKDYYLSTDHPRSVGQILAHPSDFDNTSQIIEGYVSSVIAYSVSDEKIVCYYLVDDPIDIMGFYYPTANDINSIIENMRIENRRTLNYGSIAFELDYNGPATIAPGQCISIRATVYDVEAIGSILLEDTKILSAQK